MKRSIPSLTILALAGLVFFQTPARAEDPEVSTSASAPTAATAVVVVPAPKPVKPLFGRWLDLTTMSHAERYRNAFNNGGQHVFEDGQQRSLIQGRFLLDSKDRYTIGFRASSGRYFNWAYADYAGKGFKTSIGSPTFLGDSFTPAQMAEFFQSFYTDPAGLAILGACQSAGWEFYVRELFFSATPVKGITAEVGSFGIERGLSTEITTFDEDGFLTGERVRVKDPKHLYFDEVGYTNAYFGDIATMNVFARGASYKMNNYHQFFLNKKLNSHVGFSGEFTNQVGTNTVREAVAVNTKELKIFDRVRFEGYQRLNAANLQGATIAGGSGFAIAVEKKITERLSADAGYASVDQAYGVYTGHRAVQAVGFTLNGDTYGLGDRPFFHASYKINPAITAFGFYTHALGPRTEITLNQQGMNVGLNFDLKAIVNSGKQVF